MESPRANFVAMFMDRLQTLESRVDVLQQEKNKLALELIAVKSALHLKKDLMTFSDGFELVPGFGAGGAMLHPPDACSACSDYRELPIDDLHRQATAFHGQISIGFYCDNDSERVLVGEKDRRVTVQEFLDAIDILSEAFDAQHADRFGITAADTNGEGYAGWVMNFDTSQSEYTTADLKMLY